MKDQSSQANEKQEKVVYVIGQRGGPLKIGIADNAKTRRSILNVGNPHFLHLFYEHECEDESGARRLEKALHHHFLSKHIRGEWFDLVSLSRQRRFAQCS